ncbi:FtsX-like permease family protein [Flavobacteriaceae bacterium R38]|nr:FtsX-like permease family protein [Flavobacteriaceae bacterium R38]
MIKHHLLLFFRNLRKEKSYSLMNISGLVIGLVAVLLITDYVISEFSYEKHITASQNIYRIGLDYASPDEQVFKSAENYPGVAEALKENLPEVEKYARLFDIGRKSNVVITYKNNDEQSVASKQRSVFFADPSFLLMFSVKMVEGNLETALSEPHSIVISEDQAKRYFKNENPIGKSLRMQNDEYGDDFTLRVTGVFKTPSVTHLNYDFLISYSTLYSRRSNAIDYFRHSWQRKQVYTYVQLRPGTTVETFEANLPSVIKKYDSDQSNHAIKFIVQPLKDIHLYSNLADENGVNGSARYVYMFIVIGLAILFMALINYVNLTTARSITRAKEVGVQKVMGASKKQLISQFMTESFVFNTIAILIAVFVASLISPVFRQLMGLDSEILIFQQPTFLFQVVILWMLSSLLSGFYPSFILSSFKPMNTLKGEFNTSNKGNILRKGLVVFQFAASSILITGTILITQQIDFMLSEDLGFNPNQVMVVERAGALPSNEQTLENSIALFKRSTQDLASVAYTSTAQSIPGKKMKRVFSIKKQGSVESPAVTTQVSGVDYDFINTLEMKLIAGRNLSRDFAKRNEGVLVTRSLVDKLGFNNPEEALGEFLTIKGDEFSKPIIGVLENYHHESLKESVIPTMYWVNLFDGEYFFMKVKTDKNLKATISGIKDKWAEAFPGNPFEYYFLDTYFDRQYANELQFKSLFNVFTWLSICIGCLGLFNLSAFTVNQRMKEMSVRKVLGADAKHILTLLSKQFFMLIVIAVLIAIPVTFYLINDWLSEFAHHIKINAWTFVSSALIVFVISGIAISFQTVRAVVANPVNHLKD